MAVVGLPTWSNREVVTTAKLQQYTDVLEAKFAGGIGPEDLVWPLVAQNDIDMGHFEIKNLAVLWSIYNLAERDPADTVQDVFDLVDGAGGGIVLLPANTTETLGTAGVSVGPDTIIMGQGHSSVFDTTGVLTNHMFRNKANGDSNISFINVTIDNSGASGGAFDSVGLQRTQNVRFIDCKFITGQEYAISLDTDTAGQSCEDTYIERCRFNTSGGSGSILTTDIVNLNIRNNHFDHTGANTIGITHTADGATSACREVSIVDNLFEHATGSNQACVTITAGSTTSGNRVVISDNKVTSSGVLDHWFDYDGATASVVQRLSIHDNTGSTGATTNFAVRIRNCQEFDVNSNKITVTGGAIGLLIGATARSGSVAPCRRYTVADNRIFAADSCYVFTHPGNSDAMFASISDNWADCNDAAVAEYEIWGVLANPHTVSIDAKITGNLVSDTSGSVASWRVYTDQGSTHGGRLGDAVPSRLIFLHNDIDGVDYGTAGANDDFDDADFPNSSALYIGTKTQNIGVSV